jgi:hypothetical protein
MDYQELQSLATTPWARPQTTPSSRGRRPSSTRRVTFGVVRDEHFAPLVPIH